MDTHFSKLPNSLIEICVVVGMDQDTGLVLARSAESKKASKSSKQESPLSQTLFETHVLAALSGEVASFCCTAVEFDSEPYYSNLGILCSPAKGGNPGRRARRGSVRVKTAELPLTQEVISSLPQFCFPDGGTISKKKKPVECHSLVLTDMEGNRTYCSCMTFYRGFLIEEDTDLPGNYKLFYADEKTDGQVAQDSSHQLYYVPTCCCLISKWPYFNIMKDCMSSLLPQVMTSDPALFRTALMQFVSQLAMVPVPPPGSLGIEFELLGVKHLLRPAETPEHRVVNMDLHYPFLYFSLDDIHLLMSCILTQQRIVFLSSSYSLLTPVIESLFTFIQPFLWSWTYVPILPSALLDLVEAPGAFIMGCHREHKSKIERVVKEMDEFSTFVIADIDEGSVKSPPRIQRLPTYAAELYKFRMKNAVIHFDSLLLQRQTFYSLQEWKESRDQFVRNFQQLVLASNLEMMLRMFSDIKNYIVQQEDLFFDMDTYIESKPLDNQGFFREVCKSHGFSMFLYDLIHNPEKTDYFTLMAQKTRVVPKVGPLRKRSSSALSAVPVIPDQCFVNAQEELSIFALPPFAHGGIHTGRFYEDYLKSLNTKITDPTNMSSSLLASHLYLRGMLRIARRENTKAVDDFFGVSSRSAQLFPSSTVKEIICKLSDSEVAELKTRHFWRKAELLRIDAKEKWNYIRESLRNDIVQRPPKPSQSWIKFSPISEVREKEVVTSAIPSTPLALEEFVKHASMLQIANSQDAGRRLFQALTNDSTSTVVDPETFATFYYAFTEASIKAKSLSLRNIVLERNEYVLKVSKHIKTNKGMGWLVLTVDRLLFLPDGTQNCTSVLCNEEIMNVEPHSESRLSRYGYSDTAIRITSTARDSVSFIAHVKEEKDFWRSCLLEMKAAYMISDIYKDKEIVKQAAQNVIMADSLSQSNYSDQVAMQVLYYSTQSHHKSKLTRPTEKTLFMRVNPSPQDIEKTTVEALLYVPRSKERERKIWCAMGSGLVVVVDTKDWECEMHMKHAKDRVSCLLAVGENQVWAGSLDTTIYVINTQTGKADQQLLGHHDLLSCMIQTKDSQGQTTVWSAGLNGQIVGWDPVTLTAKKEVKLDQRNGKTLYSIAEVGNTFWCATRFNVVVINYNGDDNEAKTLTPKEGEQMSVDTMCAVSEKEVWTGCDKKGLVVIWSTKTYKNKHHTVCECNGFTCMLKVEDRVWAGSKNGNIYVIGVKQFKVIMELSLHQDRVRSMCLTDEGFVVSGPGSRDGRIAVWKSHLFEECSNVQHSSHERSKFPQQIMEEISTCGEEGGFALVCKKKTVKVDVDCNKIRDKPSRPTNKR